MTEIRSEAIYFADCLGWLHVPHPLHAGLRGVILCAPLGDEGLGTYRAWRGLADRLAGVGMPVLRFDYPASGDSLLAEGEAPGLRPWLNSICEAARHLREYCGVAEVTLCGLRMGATLAALAAAEVDATRIVALAPFATGRAYVRELRASARMLAAIWQVPAAIEQEGWFEAMGVRWDAQTRQEMEEIDLVALERRPAKAALILASAGAVAGLETVFERWHDLGCAAVIEPVVDLEAYLQESSTAAVPHSTFDRVVAWLAEDRPRATTGELVYKWTVPGPVDVGRARELPVWFGEGGRGFGIWCQPLASDRHDLPTVVILNTTLNPRSGNSRMAVTLARSLAAQGVSSFRIDNIGSGDSLPEPDERAHPYAEKNTDLVKSALDWVTVRKQGSLVLFGLCSGAYTAFHVAVEDVRVRAVILVNMQKIIWSAGMSLKVIQQGTLRSGYYLKRLGQGMAWKQLVRGDVAIRRIGGELARRAATGLINSLQARLGRHAFGNTASAVVWRWFDDLHRRRVEVLMLLGCHDPARDEIEIYFGPAGKRLRSYPAVNLKVVEGMDHSLSTAAMRRQVIEHVSATLMSSPAFVEIRHNRADAQRGRQRLLTSR